MGIFFRNDDPGWILANYLVNCVLLSSVMERGGVCPFSSTKLLGMGNKRHLRNTLSQTRLFQLYLRQICHVSSSKHHLTFCCQVKLMWLEQAFVTDMDRQTDCRITSHQGVLQPTGSCCFDDVNLCWFLQKKDCNVGNQRSWWMRIFETF